MHSAKGMLLMVVVVVHSGEAESKVELRDDHGQKGREESVGSGRGRGGCGRVAVRSTDYHGQGLVAVVTLSAGG